LASFGLLKTTAADIERTLITGRAVMPAFAGLLLSKAIMIWPRQKWRGQRSKSTEVPVLETVSRSPGAGFAARLGHYDAQPRIKRDGNVRR